MKIRTVSVVGSTGSIGKTALNVIRRQGYRVLALSAHSNLELLNKQVQEFCPEVVGVINPDLYHDAKRLFGSRLVMGQDALTIPAALPEVDSVLVSVTGLSGIHPLMAALAQGKRVALANKESLVAGGELVSRLYGGKNGLAGKLRLKPNKLGQNLSEVGQNKSGQTTDNRYSDNQYKDNQHRDKTQIQSKICPEIIPVDSEHSAVFQCLKSGRCKDLDKIILTASGGAFYNLDKTELDKVTPDKIFHPNWSMGRKITLDSCTMMNKALEIIEAYWLFGTDRIDYVVHPESIIHSMVKFLDGSVIAQLAPPDMSLPISYALTYPQRPPMHSDKSGKNADKGGKADNSRGFDDDSDNLMFGKPLSFAKKNKLFYAPDLAHQVIKMGGTAGAIFNAAGEAASQLFEDGKILFTEIVKITKNCLSMSDIVPVKSLEDVILAHNSTIERVKMDYRILKN